MKYLYLVLFCSMQTIIAHANSGSAHIPPTECYFSSGDLFKRTSINVSNITDSNVEITITLYNHNGILVTDGDNNPSGGNLQAHFNYQNYTDNLTDSSLSLTIPANGAVQIWIHGGQGSQSILCSGKIEWTQQSKAAIALIASIENREFWRDSRRASSGRNALQINNGQPF